MLTPLSVVVVGGIVALSLFFLLPSSLSSLSFGNIVITVVVVAAVVAVALVAPAIVAPANFIVALAVIPTTFLAIDVTLVVDCCVPLLPDEDRRLPPPSGKTPSWPSLP